MAEKIPPFNPNATSRFDQSTYVGRLKHNLETMNPLTLFTSEAELQKSLQMLERFKQKGKLPEGVDDLAMWKAKVMKDSMVHPDTGKTIFPLFRMAGFTPVNMPVVAGMLFSKPTFFNTVFWQWINQSVNVAVNYANRNASNEMSQTQIAKAYGAAVGTSCSLAVGLGAIAKRSSSVWLPKAVPFISVATAGALNVLLMRWNEAEVGITVSDGTRDVGTSKLAGKMALQQVALTRVVLPAPVLLLPPLLASVMTRMVAGNPRYSTLIQLVSVASSLLFAMPVAIALFPQVTEVSPDQLEDNFRNMKNEKGEVITKFYFNKGL